jgi:hypothetical protein
LPLGWQNGTVCLVLVCPAIKLLKAGYTNLSGEVETPTPPFGELISKKIIVIRILLESNLLER